LAHKKTGKGYLLPAAICCGDSPCDTSWGADFDFPTGFYKQVRMSEPTAMTMDVYAYVLKLFYTHWDRRPVRALGAGLAGLLDLREIQLSLVDTQSFLVLGVEAYHAG
jgi:hypothetical protein